MHVHLKATRVSCESHDVAQLFKNKSAESLAMAIFVGYAVFGQPIRAQVVVKSHVFRNTLPDSRGQF